MAYDKILITGAGSGIGRACARQLAAKNKALFLTTRDDEKLGSVREECAGASACAGTAADLCKPGEAARVVEEAAEALDGLDAVVHAAGVGLIKPAADTTDSEFSKVLNINVRATFLVAVEACKVMAAAKRGRFLTLPGVLGKAPMRGASAYVASKYAVTGLVKTLSQEYHRQGIQFCLFHFGGVDTPFWDDLAMKVQRDKMIPVETAAAHVVAAIEAPDHLVTAEVVVQPESHQML